MVSIISFAFSSLFTYHLAIINFSFFPYLFIEISDFDFVHFRFQYLPNSAIFWNFSFIMVFFTTNSNLNYLLLTYQI